MYWIIVRFEGGGFHRWKDAPDQHADLRNHHHHTFRVTCRIEAAHGDREIEFITAGHLLRQWFQLKLSSRAFFDLSCEQMARQIATHVADEFQVTGLIDVEVTEDGIHGGGYGKPRPTS